MLGLIGFDSQSRRRRTRNQHLPAHCRRLSAQPGDLYTQSLSSRTHQQGGNDIYLNSVTLLLYHGGLPHARGQVCLIEPHPGRPIRPRRLAHLYFSVSPLAGLDFSHHFPQFPCPRSPQFKYAGRPLRSGNRAQQLEAKPGWLSQSPSLLASGHLFPLLVLVAISLHVQHLEFHSLPVQDARNTSPHPSVHGQRRRARACAVSGSSRKLQRATFSDWCRGAGQLIHSPSRYPQRGTIQHALG